jgi:hypothetical protein
MVVWMAGSGVWVLGCVQDADRSRNRVLISYKTADVVLAASKVSKASASAAGYDSEDDPSAANGAATSAVSREVWVDIDSDGKYLLRNSSIFLSFFPFIYSFLKIYFRSVQRWDAYQDS